MKKYFWSTADELPEIVESFTFRNSKQNYENCFREDVLLWLVMNYSEQNSPSLTASKGNIDN